MVRDLRRYGVYRVERLPYASDLIRVPCADQQLCSDVLAVLVNDPGRILEAELDQVLWLPKSFGKEARDLDSSWWLQAEPGQAWIDMNVGSAWRYTEGDPRVVIGILDDGVDLRHPAFEHVLPPLNYPLQWQADWSGAGAFAEHGTRCAGLAVAAQGDFQGAVGVCPRCTLLASVVGGSGADHFQASASELAAHMVELVDGGAWVISNSWSAAGGDPGFVTSQPAPAGRSIALSAAMRYAEFQGRAGLGTVVVFAAGNGNEEVAPFVLYPNSVIVAAVTDQGRKAPYSNFGPAVTVSAPSDGGAAGLTTTAPLNDGKPAYDEDFGGTSAACPLVAGVVGLAMAANPSLTAAEVRALLTRTASKVDSEGGAWVKGHSPYYGYGLVDASLVVRSALGLCAEGQCESRMLSPAPSGCGSAGVVCRRDEVCAAGECVDACNTDGDCSLSQSCRSTKDLYGRKQARRRGCGVDLARKCQLQCETISAIADKAWRSDWVACVDSAEHCTERASCKDIWDSWYGR